MLMIFSLFSCNFLKFFLSGVRDLKEIVANIHSSGMLLSPAVTDLSLATKLIHTEMIIFFIEHSAPPTAC